MEDLPNENLVEKQDQAKNLLVLLASVLNDVENAGTFVDLNQDSANFSTNVPSIEWVDGKWEINYDNKPTPASQFQALGITLENLKKNLSYLDPRQREKADELILKTEIYISAHQPGGKKVREDFPWNSRGGPMIFPRR